METPAPTTETRIAEALQTIDNLKASFQEGINQLKTLGTTLKQVQREQKASEREIQAARSALRSLQSVKL